jgi:hypothetical protein
LRLLSETVLAEAFQQSSSASPRIDTVPASMPGHFVCGNPLPKVNLSHAILAITCPMKTKAALPAFSLVMFYGLTGSEFADEI